MRDLDTAAAGAAGARQGARLAERHSCAEAGGAGSAERLIGGANGWVPCLFDLSAAGLPDDSFRILFARAGSWHAKLNESAEVRLDQSLGHRAGGAERGLREEDLGALILSTCVEGEFGHGPILAFWRGFFGRYPHPLACLPFTLGLMLLRRCVRGVSGGMHGIAPFLRAAAAATQQPLDQGKSLLLVELLLRMLEPGGLSEQAPPANPFGAGGAVLSFPEALLPSPEEVQRTLDLPERLLTVAGRVSAVRRHSRMTFFDLESGGNKLQAAAQHQNSQRAIGAPRAGQLVCLSGELALARSGEPTLFIHTMHWASEANEYGPMPGLPGTAHSLAMSAVLDGVRANMAQHGFRELATAVLGPFRGGASRPFETWLHAEQRPVYLRSTMEMELRSAIVAGIPRCFQIGPVFRNGSRDKWHNPEYLQLEAYAAFASVDETTRHATETVLAGLGLDPDRDIPIVGLPGVLDLASRRGVQTHLDGGIGGACRAASASLPDIWICDGLPAGPSPLNADDEPRRLIVAYGQKIAEIAVAATQAPLIRARMEAQARQDPPEVTREFETFVDLLRRGHPPCCGLAISLSRLIQMRSGSDRLKDVLPYFPR